MASTHTHIPDMGAAIRNGVVPGAFNADRTAFEFPTLAYAGSRGKELRWSISVRLIRASGCAPILDEMLNGSPSPRLEISDRAEISVVAQQEGGKVRDAVPTYVAMGKNIGRKNETNVLTQAIRDALGLYNTKRKKMSVVDSTPSPAANNIPPGGHRPNNTTATLVPTLRKAVNERMPPPMLVQKPGDTRAAILTLKDFEEGVTAQDKFDGVRLVTFFEPAEEEPAEEGPAGRVVFYSRSGTEYPIQAHIAEELAIMFAANTFNPELGPIYLDGELYLHGRNLGQISGQARKAGSRPDKLEYHIYDVFFPRAPSTGPTSRERQAYLDRFFAMTPSTIPGVVRARAMVQDIADTKCIIAGELGARPLYVRRVKNTRVGSAVELEAYAKDAIARGYEGAIARRDGATYEYSYNNRHSPALIKIKPKFDSEFPVVGYAQGTKGKDVGAVIWVCEVPTPVDPNDRHFSVVPKDMTYEQRKAIFTRLENDSSLFDQLRGLPLTVEYAGLSEKTGKPLQAKALAFRTYEAGPDADPVQKLLNN